MLSEIYIFLTLSFLNESLIDVTLTPSYSYGITNVSLNPLYSVISKVSLTLLYEKLSIFFVYLSFSLSAIFS